MGARRAHQLGTTSQRRTPPTTIVVARSDVDPGRFGGNGTGSGDWPGAVADLVPNAEAARSPVQMAGIGEGIQTDSGETVE